MKSTKILKAAKPKGGTGKGAVALVEGSKSRGPVSAKPTKKQRYK